MMLVTGFSQGVANPLPFPFRLLVGTIPYVLVPNPLWLPDSKDVPEPVVDEVLKFGDDPFSQSPCLRAV